MLRHTKTLCKAWYGSCKTKKVKGFTQNPWVKNYTDQKYELGANADTEFGKLLPKNIETNSKNVKTLEDKKKR